MGQNSDLHFRELANHFASICESLLSLSIMVFFVCEGCNETVKKNQVDKHALRCRNCYAVTCVDCQVSFYGNDYAAHISCISEAGSYILPTDF